MDGVSVACVIKHYEDEKKKHFSIKTDETCLKETTAKVLLHNNKEYFLYQWLDLNSSGGGGDGCSQMHLVRFST